MNNTEYEYLKKMSSSTSPKDLICQLGFQKTLYLSCKMLDNEVWDYLLQEYATKLLEELKIAYSKEWNSSWKYEALLGYAYDIILKYDERYIAYKNAMAMVQPTPPQLLIAMARCCIAPGKPPLTYDEAIALVKEAIQSTPYIEGIELLIGLYNFAGNSKEERHWEKILDLEKNKETHLPSLLDI